MIEAVPLRQFAELLERRPEKRMSLLRKLAFPSKRFAPPYARARPLIRKHVAGIATRAELLKAASEWRRRARGGGKQARNLLNNAAMVERFVSNFDMAGVERGFTETFVTTFGDLSVLVVPDLCVVRHAREEFTKLIFAKAAQSPQQLRINALMASLMFDAVQASYPAVASREVQLFNVAYGRPLWGEPLAPSTRQASIELAEQVVVTVERLRQRASEAPGSHR